jgi:urease subunit alpha
LNKHIVPIDSTRNIGKKDMKLNDTTPVITVHPETYRVEADDVHFTCAPAVSVPLAQRYFIV